LADGWIRVEDALKVKISRPFNCQPHVVHLIPLNGWPHIQTYRIQSVNQYITRHLYHPYHHYKLIPTINLQHNQPSTGRITECIDR
jgi:hypothetical protein